MRHYYEVGAHYKEEDASYKTYELNDISRHHGVIVVYGHTSDLADLVVKLLNNYEEEKKKEEREIYEADLAAQFSDPNL